MAGFALPRLKWLVLGALAAGGWAMTQEAPSKLISPEKPAKAIVRPKAEVRPQADARPRAELQAKATVKPAVEARQKPVLRPKADVGPRAEVRPKAEPAANAGTPRPTPRPRAGADNQQTAAIARPPRALTTTAQKSLAAVTPAPRPQGQGGIVLYTRASVNLRQRADVSSPVLHLLKQGEAVRVFAREGKWRLVLTAGRKGWVHEDQLVQPDPAAPRPSQGITPTPKTASSG